MRYTRLLIPASHLGPIYSGGVMDTQQSLFDGIVPWATDAPLVVVVQRLGPTGPTLRVRIPRSWCDTIAMGACLEVPVGRHSEYVYIVSLQDTDPPHPGAGSPISIPDAVRRVEGAALPPTVMRLAEWGARYYACSLGASWPGSCPAPSARNRSRRLTGGWCWRRAGIASRSGVGRRPSWPFSLSIPI